MQRPGKGVNLSKGGGKCRGRERGINLSMGEGKVQRPGNLSLEIKEKFFVFLN